LWQEAQEAERFWIIYAPENLPSGAGMRKAGFTPAAELSFDADHQVRLAPLGAHEHARAAAELLGVPLIDDPLAPCWCCQSGETAGTASTTCWPLLSLRRWHVVARSNASHRPFRSPEAQRGALCNAASAHSIGDLIMQQEHYEIQVKGHLSVDWLDWFDGLTVTNLDGGEATISGHIADQAALYGVLTRLYFLNLTLPGVRRIAPD
jgi:hypothetical protein